LFDPKIPYSEGGAVDKYRQEVADKLCAENPLDRVNQDTLAMGLAVTMWRAGDCSG
jgi:hypothetical protein